MKTILETLALIAILARNGNLSRIITMTSVKLLCIVLYALLSYGSGISDETHAAPARCEANRGPSVQSKSALPVRQPHVLKPAGSLNVAVPKSPAQAESPIVLRPAPAAAQAGTSHSESPPRPASQVAATAGAAGSDSDVEVIVECLNDLFCLL